MMKLKLKRGDKVKVIAGKFNNKEGQIIKILRKKERIFAQIEGLTIKKHKKASQQNQEGGIIDIPVAIEYSNIALIDPKDKKNVTKIGYQIGKDGKKTRIARKSKAEIAA